jgi:hypothetical protein
VCFPYSVYSSWDTSLGILQFSGNTCLHTGMLACSCSCKGGSREVLEVLRDDSAV